MSQTHHPQGNRIQDPYQRLRPPQPGSYLPCTFLPTTQYQLHLLPHRAPLQSLEGLPKTVDMPEEEPR